MTEISIKLIRLSPNYGKSADLLGAGVEMKNMLSVKRHFNTITWHPFKNEIDNCPFTAGSRGVVCKLCKIFSWSRLERQPASAGEIYRLAIELSTFR